jgi:hypothetical protein
MPFLVILLLTLSVAPRYGTPAGVLFFLGGAWSGGIERVCVLNHRLPAVIPSGSVCWLLVGYPGGMKDGSRWLSPVGDTTGKEVPEFCILKGC